jgi:ferredoxin
VEGSQLEGHDQPSSGEEVGMSGAIRVNIDLSRCEGHGRCMVSAPQIFGYNDVTSQAYVLADGVLDSNRAGILRAAQDCPERAIIVIKDNSQV